jgi:hypothetical protein
MRAAPVLVCAAVLAVLAGCSASRDNNDFLPVHCLDTPDPGPCNARIPAYYYDYPSDSCRMFHYGGCRGHVPFESRPACEEACVAGRD